MPTHKVIHICKPHEPTHEPKLAKEYAFPNAPADRLADGRKEHRTDNSGFAKKRVQWLIEHSTSHQHLWYVDSFVLRNPPLRQAPKRYNSLPGHSVRRKILH